MQVTTNILGNKVDLSNAAKAKLDTKVKDEVTARLETKVKDEVKDGVKDRAEFKLEVLVSVIKDLGGALDFAIQCASGSSVSPEDQELDSKIDAIDDLVEIDEKVRKFKVALVKVAPELAGILAGFRNVKEARKEEGENKDNVSVNDRTIEDADKSFLTFEFETNKNVMPDDLYSLLDDIIADIKEVDTSNTEAYLEKLNGYKDSLLRIQADLEYEDPEMAITKYKSQEVAYQACLAMQPNIFQPTLLDYVS